MKEQGGITISKKNSLLQRAQAYEPEALSQIFDKHYEHIYRYAYRRLATKEQAEGVASESFCRLLDAFKNGKGPSDGVRYWLYCVAHNLIVDIYRKSDRDPLPLFEKVISDWDPLPEEMLLLEQKQARVRWALTQLTEDQQQVLELKFMEELSNKQAAKILGKTIGAVKSLQHRGLASLERFLEQAPDDQELWQTLPASEEQAKK